MKHLLARFKVRSSEVSRADKAIIAFVSKVSDEPGTLRYESFREADGVSYVHLMSFADAAAEAVHRDTDHAKKFAAALSTLCELEPVFTALSKVSGAGR
jgi:quinol monooxygenase YgiN